MIGGSSAENGDDRKTDGNRSRRDDRSAAMVYKSTMYQTQARLPIPARQPKSASVYCSTGVA